MSSTAQNNIMESDASEITLRGLHQRMRKQIPQPANCQICNEATTKLDLANISHQYMPTVDDWKYLCRRCHLRFDGRSGILSEKRRTIAVKESVYNRLAKTGDLTVNFSDAIDALLKKQGL